MVPSFLAVLWQRLTRDEHDGPLAGFLIVLTVASGMVDAVSILRLGHVFTAAMTGNLLFIGFALAGAPGFSALASLDAVGAFVIGSGLGGSMVQRAERHRSQLLRDAAGVQLVALVVATVILAAIGDSTHPAPRYGLIAILALGLGVQTAAVRNVGVRAITTTVLTTTLSTLLSDLRPLDWRAPEVQLRILAIVVEVLGAVIGTLLVLDVSAWCSLLVAAFVTAAVAGAAHLASRRSAAWNIGGGP